MKINKTAAYVLLYVLNGSTTAKDIAGQLVSLDVRSVQRALLRLTEAGLLTRSGPANNRVYQVDYKNLLQADIPKKILEDESRPESRFNHELLKWLESLPKSELEVLFSDDVASSASCSLNHEMSAKDLEYLMVELSWKSSALEGNTYTLLDTQLLLLEGVKAKNKTDFETQMVLNHKNAISFIGEHKDLFYKNISFAAVEELHRIIGFNLGIGPGVRKKLVRISASNYMPLANPHQLKENAQIVLDVINKAPDPFAKALLALTLFPYLQVFEDGNKRTGRILANAILIHGLGKGFSLRKTDSKRLALAYLSFYEFNSIRALGKILHNELA